MSDRFLVASSAFINYLALAFPAFLIVCQRQPRNITRADGETDVFMPCPFEFRPTPSIWKIGGKDYTATTIPSIFSITPGGLFINTVHICLNQTSFQCIDTSDNALEEQLSDIGILTVVTSQDNCTGEMPTCMIIQTGTLAYKSRDFFRRKNLRT